MSNRAGPNDHAVRGSERGQVGEKETTSRFKEGLHEYGVVNRIQDGEEREERDRWAKQIGGVTAKSRRDIDTAGGFRKNRFI